MISLSLKFNLFKLTNEYNASGTFGKAFSARSTSVKFTKFSKLPGKLLKFLWVFLRWSVSKLTKLGSCLSWKRPIGLLFKTNVCRFAKRLVWGGSVSNELLLKSKNRRSVRLINSELGIASMLKINSTEFEYSECLWKLLHYVKDTYWLWLKFKTSKLLALSNPSGISFKLLWLKSNVLSSSK